MEKCEKCKYQDLNSSNLTFKCGLDMEQYNKTEDEDCEHYESKYIEYPLTINGIENHFNDNMYSLYSCGKLVKIKPCGEEYKSKTYLGILLGELPIGAFISYYGDDRKIHVNPHMNVGIFVPELKKIVYGCESWWSEIKNPEDFAEITSEDIENVWYVKLLKSMIDKKQEENT